MNIPRRIAMCREDIDYFESRLARELDMAERAKTLEAAAVHTLLARQYRAQLDGVAEIALLPRA
jgi:hypothetical protein